MTKYISLGGRPVAKRVGTSTFFLHADHLGSIQVVTDAQGAEVQRLTHRPWGQRLSSSTGHAESLGFTGQRQDESGLIYLHARYYDPVLGRFLSPDPVLDDRTSVGLNGYAYAGNDPVNATDIDGQRSLRKKLKKLVKGVKKLVKLAVKIMRQRHPNPRLRSSRPRSPRAMLSCAKFVNGIPIIGGILALPIALGSRRRKEGLADAAEDVGHLCHRRGRDRGRRRIPSGDPGLRRRPRGGRGAGAAGGLVGALAVAAAAFAVGFVGGFAIGLINGAPPGQAFYVGMSFGMFAMTVASIAGFKRPDQPAGRQSLAS
jgi:RHS repeat-associated protein